jgi:hypothetical protein
MLEDYALTLKSLPPDHPYIRMELEEMAEQLENEVRDVSEAMGRLWSLTGRSAVSSVEQGSGICSARCGPSKETETELSLRSVLWFASR